jgi:hypothetical protein
MMQTVTTDEGKAYVFLAVEPANSDLRLRATVCRYTG